MAHRLHIIHHSDQSSQYTSLAFGKPVQGSGGTALHEQSLPEAPLGKAE